MEEWACFHISQDTKIAMIKLQEVLLQYVGWWKFQDILIPSRFWKCLELQCTIFDLLDSKIHPLSVLPSATLCLTTKLCHSIHRAHMMDMDVLANQQYYRCCNCAIKTDKKNTHPYSHLILNFSIIFSLGYWLYFSILLFHALLCMN